MSRVKFKLNGAGVRELLKSKEMAEIVGSHAAMVAGSAGSGYAATTINMGTRVVGKAYADNWDAVKDNAKNNTLLKALGSSK